MYKNQRMWCDALLYGQYWGWEKFKGLMKIWKGMLIIENYNNVHTVMMFWQKNPMNRNQSNESLPPLNPSPRVPASQCIPHCNCNKVSCKAHFRCLTTWQKLRTKTLCIWLLSNTLHIWLVSNTLHIWLLSTIHCTCLLSHYLCTWLSETFSEWLCPKSSTLPSPSNVWPFPKIRLVLWRHHHEKRISSNGKVTAFTGCVPNKATLMGTAWAKYMMCSNIQKRHSSKTCSSHLKNVSQLLLIIILFLITLAHPSHKRIPRWWYPSHGSPSSVPRWTSPFQAVVFQVASCPW